LVLGTRSDGIRGAALAHLVVALAVVVPAYVVVLGRIGIPMARLAAATRRPLAAAVIMAAVAYVVDRSLGGGFGGLLAAGVLGGLVYAALVVPWQGGRPQWRSLVSMARDPVPTSDRQHLEGPAVTEPAAPVGAGANATGTS
jgi:PST family polysaccharide transporter